MGKLSELVQKWYPLPTIMEIDQEIDVIRDLMAIPIEELVTEEGILYEILDDLSESHGGGGYFQITRDNEKYFIEFCQWLERVYEETGLDVGSNGFNTTYDDLVRTYPSVLERDKKSKK
jgi:hypothetical protein